MTATPICRPHLGSGPMNMFLFQKVQSTIDLPGPTWTMVTPQGSCDSMRTDRKANSVLSPTATPFYPANATSRDAAESQENVSTLSTGQHFDVSRLQESWSHAADLRSANDYVGDHGIADLSNLLAVPPSATILPHLCVLLNMLCLELVGVQKTATESLIRTHWLANQTIPQQHLQMGVVRRIRSETRYASAMTATENNSDGTKNRDLLSNELLSTSRP